MRWLIQLLGSLSAKREDRTITRFRTQKTGTLLAYLAFYPRQHTREALAGLFWPDYEDSVARQNLNVALSSLRRQLEPPGVPAGSVIVADRFSVELNTTAVETD